MTRAEWIAIAALIVTLLQGAYLAGVQVQVTADNTRRIEVVESKADDASEKIARIDANVTFLTDLAREERQKRDGE